MQVADTNEFDVAQEDLKEISQGKKVGKAMDQMGVKNSKKRGRKAKEKVGITCSLKSANLVLGTNEDSNEKSQGVFKTHKRSKKVHAPCGGAESLDDGIIDMTTELPAPLGKKKRCNNDFTSNDGKSRNEIHVQNQTPQPVTSKKKKSDSLPKDSEEVCKRENQTKKDAIAQLSALLVPLVNKVNVYDSRENPSTCSRKSKSSNCGLRSQGKSKSPCSADSKDEIPDDIQAGSVNNIHVKEAQTMGNIQRNLGVGSLADTSTVKKSPSLANDMVLQRCENISSKIQCAFCLSSEDTEVIIPLIMFSWSSDIHSLMCISKYK